MTDDGPAFPADGAFYWDAAGYHYPIPAGLNLSAPGTLDDPDPWVVVAAVLERATGGDFSPLPRLLDCMARSGDSELWKACADLLGNAGPATLLAALGGLYGDAAGAGPGLRIHHCYILHVSGLLWAVPELLETYLGFEDRSGARIVPVYLSRLLEPEFGPVAAADLADPEYRALVEGLYASLRERLPGPGAAVLAGRPFSVRVLAGRLLAHLRSEDIDPVAVMSGRQYFEAATGVDCRPFFEDGELQPLAAAAVLEDFLESPAADHYEDGVRYFFGHRIPD